MGSKYLQTVLHIFLVCVIVCVKSENVISDSGVDEEEEVASRKCNLFSGEWVYDSKLNPFYDSSTCPFINSFDCIKFGRTDKQYLKYSWKPTSCKLPRFDGKDLLNRWRGKKIMFVGDSIILDQWTSLACMLHAAVPKSNTTFVRQDPISYVKFEEYNVTIFLYTSHYLVDIVKEERGRVMKPDYINHEQGNAWKGMDLLMFNTWHWWTFTGQVQEWDFVQHGKTVVKDMDRVKLFARGLRTWARWVDQNIDPSKTKVFFQGISPDHYVGQDWGPSPTVKASKCRLTEQNIQERDQKQRELCRICLTQMKNRACLLDITTLSQLRKDAHPSRYTEGHVGSDCTHWCLPGLPDTWNQLFYASLL